MSHISKLHQLYLASDDNHRKKMDEIFSDSSAFRKDAKSFEYYEELPDNIRELVMGNFSGAFIMPNSLSEAVLFGFSWNETDEGNLFWRSIYELIRHFEV